MNEYYVHKGVPEDGAPANSSDLRAEFAKIERAFSLLPPLEGNGGKQVFVDSTGTRLVASKPINESANVFTEVQTINTIGFVEYDNGYSGMNKTIFLSNGNYQKVNVNTETSIEINTTGACVGEYVVTILCNGHDVEITGINENRWVNGEAGTFVGETELWMFFDGVNITQRTMNIV